MTTLLADNYSPSVSSEDLQRHLDLMTESRVMDELEQRIIDRGEAFFSVSGAGHEATALLNLFLKDEDYLLPHYRDKALMMVRGLSSKDFFRGLLCKDTSHSRGRQMSAHLSDPENKIISLPAPMGNNALHAAGVSHALKTQGKDALSVMAVGDGTTQQGEYLESLAEAARSKLPVLFLIHDNKLAISTRTQGKTFFENSEGEELESFHSIPIVRCKSWDVQGTLEAFGKSVDFIRNGNGPVIVIIQCKRFSSHTNADSQDVYLSEEEKSENKDTYCPLVHTSSYLEETHGIKTDLPSLLKEKEEFLQKIVSDVLAEPEPEPSFDAIADFDNSTLPKNGQPISEEDSLTMLEGIREVLRRQLESNDKVSLYGQDLEDPKGDVFGLTRGLSAIRSNAVENAPLAEATILGVSIGRALAGERPVAFLQFADFLPLAYNQLVSELSSFYWRSDGNWQCPVIVMVTCGGYRPGLGPFHAQTFDSAMAATPGLDVMCPSNADDAVGMLNTAFESKRPTIFFYPKNLLNDPNRKSTLPIDANTIPLGKARVCREGENISLVGWGNTVPLLEKAADWLEENGLSADVIDLRMLKPFDEETVLKSVEKTRNILVVHEDNKTGGFGAEVVARVSENLFDKSIRSKRLARRDIPIPCHFPSQLEVLPSFRAIVDSVEDLLGLELEWPDDLAGGDHANLYQVPAIGSSPSDESVTVLEWHVKEGDEIKEGDLLADMEADKSVLEYDSPAGGKVVKFLANEGDKVPVGDTIALIETGEVTQRVKAITREKIVFPTINNAKAIAAGIGVAASGETEKAIVSIESVTMSHGSRLLTNKDLVKIVDTDEEFIRSRTGIEERHWVAEGEDAVTLGGDALKALCDKENIVLDDVDLLITATTTPPKNTPSLACLIMADAHKRHGVKAEKYPVAYDISAACSGYIFALQQAYDFLASSPGKTCVVITSEALSPLLDLKDEGTSIIFGDGATATLLRSTNPSKANGDGTKFQILARPVGGVQPDDTGALVVESHLNGCVQMKGTAVFVHAVRRMIESIREACKAIDFPPEELDLLVPHQANGRIIEAIQKRMKTDDSLIYRNVEKYGNTSSSTIPICLSEILAKGELPNRASLVAFGGGFTWGSAIIEKY